ncbi:MAG: serine/threonine-protein kinase [Gemmataceae bacterium]
MLPHNNPSAIDTLGNYDLLEIIGEGSMGIVYKARHWQTQEIFAVKVMPAHIAKNPVLLRRFEQEFHVASKLDHPNVVRVLDYSGQGKTPYLVMEYVQGQSLGDKIQREGPIPEDEALRIIIQAAHGLHRAHRQGLLHRDIKPDNILITPEGNTKITDLGLAKDSDGDYDLTRTGRGLGTPNFMAPEQFRNAKHVDARSDIYSLGATLYMMVTGKVPFGAGDPVQIMLRKLRNELPNPRELVPSLSERTDWTIRRAMSADPSKRPATCREFAEDLLGKSTRASSNPDIDVDDTDIWHVVFADVAGQIRTASGGTRTLRRSIREGRLGDAATIRASRNKVGPFELLSSYPEFRDLVVGPAPGLPLSEMSMVNLRQLAQAGAAGGPTLNAGAPGEADDDDLAERRWNTAAPFQQPAPPAASLPAGPSTNPSSNGSVPHFQIAADTTSPSASQGVLETLKTIMLVVLTVLATLIASRYLLPFLLDGQ